MQPGLRTVALGEREETVFLAFQKCSSVQRVSVVCYTMLGTLAAVLSPS